MSLPLIMQANTWVGFFFGYIAIAAIYYSNTWNASTILLPLYSDSLLFLVEIFPYASTSLFASNGSIYDQKTVFTGPQFILNQTAFHEIGNPALTGSNA